jgi:hypothetical protein
MELVTAVMSHASAARIRGIGKDIEEMTLALEIPPEFENKMLSASDLKRFRSFLPLHPERRPHPPHSACMNKLSSVSILAVPAETAMELDV